MCNEALFMLIQSLQSHETLRYKTDYEAAKARHFLIQGLDERIRNRIPQDFVFEPTDPDRLLGASTTG
jgi:hypothetical protein